MFIILWGNFSWSLGIPVDITFFGLEQKAINMKNTVFSVLLTTDNVVTDGTKFDKAGTGFLVMKNDVVIGITCEHVIRESLTNKKRVFIGLDTEDGFKKYECILTSVDAQKDIALIVPFFSSGVPKSIKNTAFSLEHLGSKSNIIEGRGIIIAGYPLDLGLEYNENHPVIRFGVIAQYAGRDHFLIDAIANPGYSGSPVFDLKEEKVIGMIQAHHKDYIDLYDKKGILAAKIPYNSGFTLAINAELISNMLNALNIIKK